jgi:hypothetical protein
MTILFNPQSLVGHEALFKLIINQTNLLAKPYANPPNLFIHMLYSFIAGIMQRPSYCGSEYTSFPFLRQPQDSQMCVICLGIFFCKTVFQSV